VKHKHHHQSVTLECLLRAQEAVASERTMTPIVPLERPDEDVLRYAHELAKRLAREDHDAEIAARQATDPATAESP
jgi:hypothetical protein